MIVAIRDVNDLFNSSKFGTMTVLYLQEKMQAGRQAELSKVIFCLLQHHSSNSNKNWNIESKST